MSFFSSSFRFVAILPAAAFDTLVKSEVGRWVDRWVGICEIVQGCRMYGRVFFFLWKISSLGIFMLKNLNSKMSGLVSG